MQPHRTLQEAAALMTARRIGAVIVSSGDGDVLGILSERDIVSAVGQHAAGVLQEAISKHMTTKVVTTQEDTSIEAVMELMTERQFRHVPVIKNGRLAGVVSIGDVVKHRLELIETEHRAMRDYIATA